MHLILCQPEYLDTYGAPTTARIGQAPAEYAVTDQTLQGGFRKLFSRLFPRDLLVMKTNVSSAHYWAVANGAGTGRVFPTYACALAGKMIPSKSSCTAFDIWLSYSSGSGRIPRVRADDRTGWWSFNPARFPWFKTNSSST